MDEKNKPLFALTVGEFLDLQKKAEPETQARETVSPALPGFTPLCIRAERNSRPVWLRHGNRQQDQAQRLIDRAVTQIGRKIIVDAPLALELVRQSKKGGRRR